MPNKLGQNNCLLRKFRINSSSILILRTNFTKFWGQILQLPSKLRNQLFIFWTVFQPWALPSDIPAAKRGLFTKKPVSPASQWKCWKSGIHGKKEQGGDKHCEGMHFKIIWLGVSHVIFTCVLLFLRNCDDLRTRVSLISVVQFLMSRIIIVK